MFNIILGMPADQRYRGPWEKAHQVTTKNANLHSLRVTNKAGSTVWVQIHDSANGAGSPETNCEEYPVPTNSTLSVVNLQYKSGIYVAAVDAAGGDAIAGNDIKIQCDYMDGPIQS